MKLQPNIKPIYKLYKLNAPILIPLVFGTMVVILLVDKIPYVNLFADFFITAVLTLNWFVILWISKITTRTMFLVGNYLFLPTLLLHYLKFQSQAETIANLVYVIFVTTFVFELIKQFRKS